MAVGAVDLQAEFARFGARNQREPCKIRQLLERLPAAERAEVDRALRSESSKLRLGAQRWLRKERGLTVNVAALGHHRAGSCDCPEHA